MRRHKHKLHPRRRPAGIAVTLGLLALAASHPAGAQAQTSCAYSGAPLNAVTVSVSGAHEAVITRRGQEITMAESGDPPKGCAGAIPTVSNTDTINVLFSDDDPGSAAQVRLAGGPLAPGATAEAVGAPEIESQVSGNGSGVSVVGTRGDDQFRWGPAGANPGLNLNPADAGDEDIDVTVLGRQTAAQLWAQGGAGNDTISGDRIPRDGRVYAFGGPGNDVLTAPPGNVDAVFRGEAGNDVITGSAFNDLLNGDAGHDRIRGAGGADRITGGTGRDRINGGAGRDVINVHDTARDTVSCGAGRDRVNTDRRDRVSGCERISRR
jgi:Ca2+-binding RTX toxin-like protein